MAIAVEGYGNITQGNAKEIYTAWKRGEVELNTAQQKKCESFLSPEEIDEVQYDEKVTEKRGKDAINTEGADGKANAASATGQSVGVAAAATGTIIAVCNGMTKLKAGGSTNGFCSLACAIVAAAGAAVALGLSFIFDTSLKDRKARSGEADTNNQTMDTYSDGLANTMDMMNEDVETYQEQQDALTTAINTQTSDAAALKMEYDNAVAMGDTNGAKAAKEQMKTLEEQDNSQLEEDLAETGGAIEEYRAMNVEALGCAESGQTVSDFLKAGKGMGALATVNATLATATAIILGIAALIGAIPKLWSPAGPIDGAPATASTILWYTAMALIGTTATRMWSIASSEFECASNGESMQDHVNNLNDMVGQQEEYATETEGAFEESDEAAAESQADAQEQADEAVSKNGDKNANKKPEEEDKKPAGAGSGGGANA